MNKNLLLNAPLSTVIAEMGHTDSLVICDAGLPIAPTTSRIDLAVSDGVPNFLQVFDVVCSSLFIEKVLLAEEIKHQNPDLHSHIKDSIIALAEKQGKPIEMSYSSHEIFKQQTKNSRAIVRTGECSPYANIILYSG
ncbi:MAG: D-ribose pyranase, partial [Gammaproteobacteria bacterium]|nr:D-ribose pyranase [Gammaproteobacteria bacterium]